MRNFLLGLGLGFLGLLGAIVFSVFAAIGHGAEVETPTWLVVLIVLSLFLMLAGPFYFWVVVLIRKWYLRRKPGT